MKHRLQRQLITEPLSRVIAKEILRQEAQVHKATQVQLKELAAACLAIKDQGLPENLMRMKLPGHLGHGIFLRPDAKPIARGQVIGPYAGIVSLPAQSLPDESSYAFAPLSDIPLSKEEQAHFDPTSRYHPKRLYWMCVDADKKGNFTRFINHSEQPNIAAEYLNIPRNRHGLSESPLEILYIAKKRIHPGEQLLISYDGDDHSYWGALGIKPVKITPKTFQLSSSLKLISYLRSSCTN